MHDDLFAYAYCYANQLTYLGSVGEHHFETHARLCRFLGLPPPARKRHFRHVISRTLDPKVYREEECGSDVNSMFTPSFLTVLRRRARMDIASEGSAVFSVGVHIRRGDVTPAQHPERYLPNAHYIRILDRILDHVPNARVTVVSEASSHESFSEFEDMGCELQLDTDVTVAWARLISSRVLIMSKSSFSYVPGLFNENLVIYTPFWHKPLEGWLDSSSADFEAMLAAKLARSG